jgi:hypothetical protein
MIHISVIIPPQNLHLSSAPQEVSQPKFWTRDLFSPHDIMLAKYETVIQLPAIQY